MRYGFFARLGIMHNVFMKICILHIGHTEPGEKPKHLPSPQRFQNALNPLLPEAQWHVVSAVKDVLPLPEAFDAYLITGGKYSVFEPLDWQDRLFDFLRSAHKQRSAVIGICYGHQAVAYALGGKVERTIGKGWGVGIMPVNVVRATGWAEAEGGVMLHAMHQDQVARLPEGAEIFLSSDFCPISGFTIGSHILCIQQHPDFTTALSADLINKRIDRIAAQAQPALESLKGRDDSAVSVRWMADFLRAALSAP